MKIEKIQRQFVDQNLVINAWSDIEPYFDQLIKTEISSKEEFLSWLQQNSELDAILEEDLGWRYIRMTINTADEEAATSYSNFIQNINPKIAGAANQINKKIYDSPYKNLLSDPAEIIYLKKIASSIEVFREENIEIKAQCQALAQEYGKIIGAQLIKYKDQEITPQQAAIYLKDPNRTIRKEVYDLLYSRRAEDIEKLEENFGSLLKKRHQIALNADFDNFRDYQFKAMCRFDYTAQDCLEFHEAIENHIVPIYRRIQRDKLQKFQLDHFQPYDTTADPEGKGPLKPFTDGKDLLAKTVSVFKEIDSYFADCLGTMDKLGHLDLDSKKGKAPGGYNYPLYETGIPFIFMNAAGTARDVVTMIHEGGHAVHSFLTRDLALTAYKSFPSEVAELASMSMELLSMKYWDIYYSNKKDLVRAQKEHLESILMILPWVARIDAFQHWIYTHPEHTPKDRQNKWLELNARFGSGLIDYEKYPLAASYGWHQQLHLFEVPFYYIEYGFSQLGAIGVWKNAIENEKKAIENYKKGLSLGYTEDIQKIYRTTGIQFDFSSTYIKDLARILTEHLNKLSSGE